MADFDVNTITVQGAIAIASATAGDKLVIDGCDATTDVLTQAQAVQIATRPSSPASTTDTIGLAGSTDNHVYAYASFIRGESTGGDVHSFLLYGHMESDATTVFVVAVASATAPTHIPASGDVTNRVEIQFELTFSATDEVVTVTDTSMYTTRGEFLILKNRTVTTHAEGQATVGENQTVYGSKDFKDAVDFNGIYTVQASRTEAQGGTDNTNTMYFSPKENLGEGPEFVAITKDNGTAITGSSASMFAGSLNMLSGGAGFTAEDNRDNTPTASMEASRGLSGASAGVDVSPTQVTLYTQSASSNARRTLSYTGGQLTGSFDTISTSKNELDIYVRASVADIDMYFDATTPDSTWSVGLTNVNDDKTAVLKFYAGADSGGQLTCEPATGGTSKLGTGDTPWDVANIGVLHQADDQVLIDDTGVSTDNLNPKNNTTIDVYGSLMPGDNGVSLGSGVKKWNELHTSVAHVGEVRYNNEFSATAYNGNTGADDYARLILDGSAEDDPFVEFQLESNAYGQSASYIFSLGYFAAPGIDLGYANGGRWNNIYANSSIHSPLLTGDQRELVLNAQGTGNGKTEVRMYCTESSVSVSINLQADQESNVVYAFTRYSFSSPGKDLGYANGGEWNNVYANEFHGKLPAPKSSDPSNPPIGTIFLACIERDASSSSYVLGAGVSLRPGYDPTCIGIYYATITTMESVTGVHRIGYGKGSALPSYTGTSGMYRTLSMADFNTATTAYVLVMRIA